MRFSFLQTAQRYYLSSVAREHRFFFSAAIIAPLREAAAPAAYDYIPPSSRRQRRQPIHTDAATIDKNKQRFLTPGFQPTSIIGDNNGFYCGSTFYDGANPPNVLPTLNAACILSPGQFCKQSSWSVSSSNRRTAAHHCGGAKKGTKSGLDAAKLLVEARREFVSLMHSELLLLGSPSLQQSQNQHGNDVDDGNHVDVVADARKIYVLAGHGVPSELLSHLIHVARGWTNTTPSLPSATSTVQILFQNIPNSTLLNRVQIQVVQSNGTTSKLPSNHYFSTVNDDDWEHNFELYMVVMDRIASRLASLVLQSVEFTTTATTSTYADDDNDEGTTTMPILGSSGSVITPATLTRWHVTIMKGEALPLSILPINQLPSSSPSSKNESLGDNGSSVNITSSRRRDRRKQNQLQPIILTVEWVIKKEKEKEKCSSSNYDCCNIVLRLQDDGYDGSSSKNIDDDDSNSRKRCSRGGRRDPISLVFDGVYE